MAKVSDAKRQVGLVSSWPDNEDLVARLKAVIAKYDSDDATLGNDDFKEVEAIIATSDARARALNSQVESLETIKILAGGTVKPRPAPSLPLQSSTSDTDVETIDPRFAEVGRAFDAVKADALAAGNAGSAYITKEHDRIDGNVRLMLSGSLKNAETLVETFKGDILELRNWVACEGRKTVVAEGWNGFKAQVAELDDAKVTAADETVAKRLAEIRFKNFDAGSVTLLENEYAEFQRVLDAAKAERVNAAKARVDAVTSELSEISAAPDQYIADARDMVVAQAEAALQKGFSKAAIAAVSKAVEDFRTLMAGYEKKVAALRSLQSLSGRVGTLSASCGSHHQTEYDRIDGNIKLVMEGAYDKEDEILTEAASDKTGLEADLDRSQEALDLIAELETRSGRVASISATCGDHHQTEFDRIKGNIELLKSGTHSNHVSILAENRTDIDGLEDRMAVSQRKLDVRDALNALKAEIDELAVPVVTDEYDALKSLVDGNLTKHVTGDAVKSALEDRLERLRADIPRQRLTKTKAAVTGDFDALKSKSADEKLKMLEIIREGGTATSAEQKTLQRTLYKSMDLDPGFEAHERGIRQTVRDRVQSRLLGDDGAKATIKGWDDAHSTADKKSAARTKINVDTIDWDNWESDPKLDAGVKADLRAKMAVAQAVLEEQCAQRGMAVPPIRFTRPSAPEPVAGQPGVTRTEKGHFSPSKGAIYLNPDPDGALSDFPDLVDTVIHENSHNYQDTLVGQLKDGSLDASDPRYQQARLFAANSAGGGYVEPGEGETPDDPYNYYKKQPLEEHAWKAGGEAKDMARELQRTARG